MEVKTIGIIGAGTMGRGIAYAAAVGGYRTILEEVMPETLAKGVAWIKQSLDEGVQRGKLEASARYAALARIETSSSVENYRAPKCLGMHFFNPVHKMKLLEIVRALETDDQTLAAAVEVGRRMGKEVVVVKESPGFITTRVNALIGNEAFAMLEAGIASAEDIDKALKLGLNHPMGPFEMVDLVGLDVRLSILEYLHATLGEKYQPNPLIKKLVAEGRLGRKSGRGVYDYSSRSILKK